MNTKNIKPSETYEGLKFQFKSLKRLLHSREAEVEYYKKRIKEFRVERIVELEAELEAEKEMNAILTEELELKHSQNVTRRSEQLKCQCKKVQFTRTVDADFNPLCGRCGKALL
jgi:predicted RNase H-like nuclease (RuvC/YqgF family)